VVHVPIQVTVDCAGDNDPSVAAAPLDVLVRVGTISSAQLQQLRRVLTELVASSSRSVVVDLADVDDANASNVFAVIVGAARKAKLTGASIRVCCSPANLRRSFAVAGLTEAPAEHTAAYSLVFDTAVDADALAV
jgi:anti-anti-sigma regulatory factor